MNFLTPGEKIKVLRKQLGMIQQDLEDENLKRNFVSMLENGERNPGRETAITIARKFNEKAKKLGLQMNLNEDYILATPQEQAKAYCTKMLQEAMDVSALEEIIQISEQYDLGKQQSEAYIRKGDLHVAQDKHGEAFIHYIRALDIYKNLQDNERQGELYNKLGLCKLNEADYNEGLEYFSKALSYSKAVNDSESYRQAVYNMMDTYRKLKRHDKTIEYADMFLKLSKNIHVDIDTGSDADANIMQLVYAKLIKTEALMGIQKYDEANALLDSMLVEHKNRKRDCGYIYNELGNVHMYKKDYAKAEEYYNLAQVMVERFDKVHIHANLIDRARLHAETEEFDKAVRLLEDGTRLAEERLDRKYLAEGFMVAAELFDKGLRDKAMEKILLLYLEMVDKLNVEIDKHRIYGRLSMLHLDKNEMEKAKEYLRLSLV